ncbi:methyltransferase type 12 [Pedobacter sp. KBW06]|uniref:class I SAM-dependent methyltransferase n=1 Tax=Pedobacter sp. KBW06 TaxID=2153359 RepID=UPI000F5B0EA6|nr:class I SAM-dependent methyltransferase [Pedobacter sp. KBW06]RQO74837.1 methyltransferase type 12 [Pedobacter sp. KBW06]
MINNYDKIANYYDRLSRLVFFKSQVNAQIHQLKYIPENSRVLIVGGGTGWILEELAKVHPAGLHIVYVEISAKMIALSKVRNVGANTVEFVNMGIEDFSSSLSFDVISSPFLFDNFSERRAWLIFEQLDDLLKEDGHWFFVDFSLNGEQGKWWKSIFLQVMYVFFKLIRIVEASELIDMEPYFKRANYRITDSQFYYGGFIRALIYHKENKLA